MSKNCYAFDDQIETDYQNRAKNVFYPTKTDIVINNFNEEVNKLINTLVDYKTIFGYKFSRKEEPCYIKYNKDSELYVIYSIKGKLIEKGIKTWREYNGEKTLFYEDEI